MIRGISTARVQTATVQSLEGSEVAEKGKSAAATPAQPETAKQNPSTATAKKSELKLGEQARSVYLNGQLKSPGAKGGTASKMAQLPGAYALATGDKIDGAPNKRQNLPAFDPNKHKVMDFSSTPFLLKKKGIEIKLNDIQVSASRDLKIGTRGSDVKSLQTRLNVWLEAKGKSTIPANGRFTRATRDAVKAFQKEMNLAQTGKVNYETRNLLKVETDPNFGRLNHEVKAMVRDRLTARDPAAGPEERRINQRLEQNLITMATHPALQNLSPAHQKQILNLHDTSKQNTKALLDLAGSPAFQRLNDQVKTQILKDASQLRYSAVKNADYYSDIRKYIASPDFRSKTPEEQKTGVENRAVSLLYEKVATDPAGEGMSYGDTSRQVKDLQKLLGMDVTGRFDLETAKRVMEYQKQSDMPVNGTVGPFMMNRLKLEKDSTYQSLDSRVKDKILDLVYASPAPDQLREGIQKLLRSDFSRISPAHQQTLLQTFADSNAVLRADILEKMNYIPPFPKQ